ncbi:MAG: ABC transporter permease [Bacteroidetes bacterium]|nr:ABC transporter permease [Bacteroidota bacterium]
MWNIIKKDLLILLSDWRAVLLTFLLPVVLVTLFALAFGGVFTDEKPSGLILLVSDADISPASASLIQLLDSVDFLEISKTDAHQATVMIRHGQAPAGLVIHKGFADSLHKGGMLPLEIVFDPARAQEIGMIKGMIMPPLIRFSLGSKISANINEEFSKQESIPEVLSSGLLSSLETIVAEKFSKKDILQDILPEETKLVAESEQSWGLIQAVAGTAVIMLLFSLGTRGASFLTEKESGTLSRLMTLPVRTSRMLLAKFWYGILIGMFQLFIMFIFAYLVFGLKLESGIVSTLLMMFATAFACSSFGLFIASICSSYNQLEIISIIVILIMSTLGGSMIPLYIMPEFMQKFAIISINYWSIQGFYDIFWRGLPFIHILPKALVLLGSGLLLLLVSMIFTRKNLSALMR